MSSKDIINFLKHEKQNLNKQFGVVDIAVFGSFAKNENVSSSDVDILVEFDKVSFDKYIKLKIFLENKLAANIDLIRKGPHLSSDFLSSIEKDLIYA
ncbi:MAG: nucleotidyltransferase domain-containing protein [Bacteroidota bacterium]